MKISLSLFSTYQKHAVLEGCQRDKVTLHTSWLKTVVSSQAIGDKVGHLHTSRTVARTPPMPTSRRRAGETSGRSRPGTSGPSL